MGRVPRIPLAAARARLAAGFAAVPVAGRLLKTHRGPAIADRSLSLPLSLWPPGIAERCLVSATLVADGDGRFALVDARVLAPGHDFPSPADRDLHDKLPLLEARAEIVRAIDAFFAARGFLAVETPARVVCPGLEPHLVPLPAGAGRWLITSPELHIKRLLAAGAERVFEIARVWRGDERGPHHLAEFTMLEWYRAYEGLDALAADLAALLPELARAAGVDPRAVPGCDLSLAPERLTVREAFRRHAGLDLASLRSRPSLAEAARSIGIPCAADDDWDEVFFRIFLERVEPHLGRGRATILEEYPASQAALATVRDDPEWPVALRFELYAGGVELANAFDELTDPAEQRRRHEADRAYRGAHGLAVPDLDEDFIAALAAGHPPAAGIALGVDRLVALLLGRDDIADVVAFPDRES